ncbi:hypothetical protein DYB34_009391 [Aphanomyces astaci]|uniref:Helicase-associated domain-containing protein n=1 Tax=Aphanomyces astaci TaxID=112090 RepID=A0A418C7J1_APHAT|nr:hypothetical protein DYB34_009391 [Aphanomyces astaci]
MRRRTLATPQSSTTSRVPWDVIVATLETYKRLHGNLQVAQAFEVPVNDERWPAGAWGLRLGCRVHNLRIAKNTLHEAKRQALDAVGFEWQGPRQSISFELKLAALTAFKAAYGHVRVPQKFTLPHADVLWTGDELKLGCVVNKLRQSQRLRRGKKGASRKDTLTRSTTWALSGVQRWTLESCDKTGCRWCCQVSYVR